MTEHANIYCALAAAQLEFGAVTKGATNPAFKSKYADLSDVASVVIPVLARHGVCVLHYLTGESLSAMRTEFVHGKSGTSAHCDVPLLVDRQNMQGMKSATTYAKRIGLESLSGVAPDDDDGNAAAAAPPKQANATQSLRQAFYDAVRDALPADATPQQHAEAITDAICQDFAGKKLKALENAWSTHQPMIERIAVKFPDLRDRLIDAYELRKNELTEHMAAE